MESNIIAKTIAFVKSELKNAEGGHDWWHVYRVWKTSKEIAKTEKVNLLVVELSSLLHDIADSKFHMGDETIGIKKAKEMKLKTICLTGALGGELVKIADISMLVPSSVTARIQEAHIIIGHIICEIAEGSFDK